jgi:3-oxoacyl-[acyl-carrier-protein] synthase-3
LLVADTPNANEVKGKGPYLFGDGGTATLLERTPGADPSCYVIGSDGSGYQDISILEGLYRSPYNIKNLKDFVNEDGTVCFKAHMDGLKVFDFTVEEVPPSIVQALELAGKAKGEIDCFVLHQANKYIIETIAQKLDLPAEKVPYSTLAKYGNLSSASVPSVICDLLRDKVSKGKATLLISGFGIGLAWATCVLALEKIYCPAITDYPFDPRA